MIIEPFLLHALLAGAGIAILAAPAGCVLVWKRMAFYGDALAHSTLFGIAIGMLWQADLRLAALVASILFALLLLWMERRQYLASDALLGIVSHTAFATGLILLSLAPRFSGDLHGFLFGDILAIGMDDIALIYIAVALVAVCLAVLWRSLVLITLHPSLAAMQRIRVSLVNTSMMLMIAVIVVLGIQIMGVLLITSLLIIPSAAARSLSRSPEQMVCWAAVIGICSVCVGVFSSYLANIPTGPAIVVAASLFFALSLLWDTCFGHHRILRR